MAEPPSQPPSSPASSTASLRRPPSAMVEGTPKMCTITIYGGGCHGVADHWPLDRGRPTAQHVPLPVIPSMDASSPPCWDAVLQPGMAGSSSQGPWRTQPAGSGLSAQPAHPHPRILSRTIYEHGIWTSLCCWSAMGISVHLSNKFHTSVLLMSATVLVACCFAVDYHELSRMDIVTKNSCVQVISLHVRLVAMHTQCFCKSFSVCDAYLVVAFLWKILCV